MIKKALLITLFVSCYSLADDIKTPKQKYIDQISEKIHGEWRMLKAKDGWSCKVQITQDKDGNILESNISECNTQNKRFVRQLQKAIDKSSPLPKAKKELFDRDLIFYFKVKGDIDVIKSVREKAKTGDPMPMRIVDDMGQYLEGMEALEARDYKTAFVKWLPLAENNHTPSQYNLGFMYSSDKGVDKDLSKSFYWYSKAAELGYAKAQYGIAWMYQNGVGVGEDVNKAVEWYKKAAEQGDKAALFTLGAMAYNGSNGVKEDRAKAKELIQQSADQGYSKAIKFLDKYKF